MYDFTITLVSSKWWTSEHRLCIIHKRHWFNVLTCQSEESKECQFNPNPILRHLLHISRLRNVSLSPSVCARGGFFFPSPRARSRRETKWAACHIYNTWTNIGARQKRQPRRTQQLFATQAAARNGANSHRRISSADLPVLVASY